MVAFRVLCLSIGAAVSAAALPARQGDCKCFPGDPCWPSDAEWASFNRTVGGRLVATVPLAAPCHDSSFGPYNESACAALQSTWWYPETHLSSSSSPMAPYFANASCDPFTAPQAQCVRGTDPQYAVRAASAADYRATLAFAAKRRLRLVIRNTGHDYNGKSTGAGALALWTHHLKDTAVLEAYESAHYRGPALRIGAGVQAHEAYVAAHAAGLAVVGGACATVGLAGGYSQGAGHGPLNSYAGLGSDQILEWEVVTAAGEHLTASPAENSDLYWALAGGGGGTYAAVVSATVRAYRLSVVSAANLTFSATGLSKDVYYDAVRAYIASLPTMTKAGTWHNWVVLADSFSLHPTVGPEMEASELDALMQPTLAFLNKSGIPYEYRVRQFSSLLEAYDGMFPRDNVTEFSLGGRLIPRSVVENNSSLMALMDVYRYINDQGGMIAGSAMDVSGFPAGGVQNAVNPVWRNSVFNNVIGLAWDPLEFAANKVPQETITNDFMPKLEALTPGSGSYSNEGDFRQPDWQDAFWGSNYPKLKEIKNKYDPSGLFYALTAVGSDEWTVHEDGRLCRIGT